MKGAVPVAAGSCSLDSSVNSVTVTQFNRAALCVTAVFLRANHLLKRQEGSHILGAVLKNGFLMQISFLKQLKLGEQNQSTLLIHRSVAGSQWGREEDIPIWQDADLSCV